ncbi:MAG: hypothetical protein NZ602_11995 [Thermoguttaceae bacterium]|nr:hypothetical protein [Thermoguttaceae bacterium]
MTGLDLLSLPAMAPLPPEILSALAKLTEAQRWALLDWIQHHRSTDIAKER